MRKLVRGERLTLSFVAVVIVAVLALAASSCAIIDNRQAINRTCEAVNETRAVNNRDRLTLMRGVRNARRSVETVKDPTLRRLLLNSITNTKAELAARPYLERLTNCAAPMPFPPPNLPPEQPSGHS